MNENQDNLDKVESVPTSESTTRVKEQSETNADISNSKQNTSYLIPASIIIGGFVFAVAYFYIQSPIQDRDVIIEIPVNIEENEGNQMLDLTTEPEYKESSISNVEKEFVHTLASDLADYGDYYTKLITQEGVTWQLHPTPVGDLELFSAEDNGRILENKKFQYYEIATVNDKQLYVVLLPICGMGCTNYMLYFIEDSVDTYTFLEAQSSNVLTEKYLGFILADNVSIDASFTLNAHQIKDEVTIEGVNFTAILGPDRISDHGLSFFADSYYNADERNYGEMIEFFAITEYGPAFRGFRKMSGGSTKDLDYSIRLAGGLMISLRYKPDFILDDRVPRITWLDGTTNESSYRTDGISGCGGGGPEVMDEKIPAEELLLAGYTINQEPVYNVVNPNQSIITRLFESSNTRNYYEYNEVTKKTETHEISKSDFIEGGVIIYIDEFGLQHVLTHTKYGPQAECAKPVVYLYPEKPTDLSVKLDALVTKSEPEYRSGWNVTAYPNGTLVVDGEEYDSLFWDGYGNGEYPEFVNGFVVSTNKAVSLMVEHLNTMGFNDKEIADFVEFWAPHMPVEPYTRFSWIGTNGMENLAELSIVPVPDTLIRAFVDFEGLNDLITMEPQVIPTYERRGFVATEWGGLLRR